MVVPEGVPPFKVVAPDWANADEIQRCATPLERWPCTTAT